MNATDRELNGANALLMYTALLGFVVLSTSLIVTVLRG